MNKTDSREPLHKAISQIEEFVENSTGKKPAPEELARALTKYFVMNEILEFIRLEREEKKGTGD